MDLSDLPLSPQDAVKWVLNWIKAMFKSVVFGLRGSVVFDNLDGFRRAKPPKKYLASNKYETYAHWWSGRGVIRPWMEHRGCNLKKLVLQDPRNTDLIDRLEATWTDLNLGSADAIWRTTENALALGAEVYWHWDWPGAALTFQNPDSARGTLSIERISAHRGPENRPISYYRRKKNKTLYDEEWRRYQDILEASERITVDHLQDMKRRELPAGTSLPEIDFEKEDKREEWPIYQVAFLTNGYEPPTIKRHWGEMNRDIQDTKNMLHAAVNRDELMPSRVKQYPNGVTRYVDREELRRFFRERGERPAFLFPDERP